MSREHVIERLSDYCDGELSSAEREALEAHLEVCAECRAELERERAVIRLAADWGRQVEPERDLWPAIEAEIRSERHSARGRVVRGPWARVSRAGLAAAAVVVAVLSLVVVRNANPPEAVRAVEPRPTMAATAEPTGSTGLALASERALVAGGLMHLREDLLRSIAARKDELDPETLAMVERNLEIIDRALGEIYQALEADPDNHVLEQLLAATYQHEADFLKQINTL